MTVILNRKTHIEGAATEAVRRAAAALYRDMRKVFLESEKEGVPICLVQDSLETEQFFLKAAKGKLELHAGDDLGFVYGIYEVSRSILGVNDFWFWNDQQFIKKEEQEIPQDYFFASKPCAVRYRGWFVNDEVLLHTWHVERRKDLPWEMVFETLLRCRGNMVIPGTDRNSARYRGLAASMGLYITHHHAEPLGAEMFARAYPELNPSYAEYPKLFQGLWKDALEAQKGMKVIWNLGFRGQGDSPFWVTDPLYETDEARGKLLSSLIRMQYDLVKEVDPQAPCCTNLYGEIFVIRELSEVLKRNGKDFWIINCSNVKPHVYFLDLIAQMWREGSAEEEVHRKEYAQRYYGVENADAAAQSLEAFHDYAVHFGEHEDERAGEQFFNHVPRMLIGQLMKNAASCCDGMRWAAPGESLKEQTQWYVSLKKSNII